MKSYAAIFLMLSFISANAQQQAQTVTQAEQQQIQQTSQSQQTESATAQVQQPQPAPPPQPQHLVLRIVGSQVRNHAGERLGLIEEVLINRANGVVDYAVVAPHFPTNSSRLVPVPWSALTYAWDQSRAGGPAGANQVFIANLDARRLAQAPSIDRARPSAMDQILASAGNFFGIPQASGAAGTPSVGVTGTAARTPDQSGAATAPINGGIIAQPVDNQVIVPGQRSTVQPGVSPPTGGGGNQIGEQPEQRVPHINGNATRAGGQSGSVPAQGTGGTGAQSGGGRSGGSATGGSGGASGGGAAGR